jgi:concentrative nucleoside transporter, CNT family
VISKIVWPETEESKTKGKVQVEIKKTHVNLLDAISHGASDGMRVSLNVIAMLIGFIALIALIDAFLGFSGRMMSQYLGASMAGVGIDIKALSLKDIMGLIFSVFAWVMGVPWSECQAVGGLMGTKMVINEFVAYSDLSTIKNTLSPKAMAIASFALCGFANFSSIAIQVGGISELAPDRRKDLARLGLWALICGTLTNWLNATLAGLIL